MWIKYLIILGLGYLGYRTLKSWTRPRLDGMGEVDNRAMGRIDDVMVKDPYCEIYFPSRNGVHLRTGGGDMVFCSKECRDKFVAEQQ